MRAATNEAVKANMAIYSVDSRGLEALPPVGNASTGSLRGTCRRTTAERCRASWTRTSDRRRCWARWRSDTGGKFF